MSRNCPSCLGNGVTGPCSKDNKSICVRCNGMGNTGFGIHPPPHSHLYEVITNRINVHVCLRREGTSPVIIQPDDVVYVRRERDATKQGVKLEHIDKENRIWYSTRERAIKELTRRAAERKKRLTEDLMDTYQTLDVLEEADPVTLEKYRIFQ